MLYFFSGTDRATARAAMDSAVQKVGKGAQVLRISDANTLADLQAALAGSGLFSEKRVVMLDSVFDHAEMAAYVMERLEDIAASESVTMLYQSAPSAELRRKLERHAKSSQRFDAPKKGREATIFELADALQRGDKKKLWVGYQRALARDEAPEAIHGVLFWGAKQAFLGAREKSDEQQRAAQLVAELAELPHASRRAGVELEYALERMILSLPRSR